ncbi:MAG: hypothetical protein KKB19_00270 [Bacteroidetes bacterium]|nr:hypothetical protein [Bacteroidota bacterium]
MWRIIGNCEDKNIINNTIQWVSNSKIFKEKSNPIILVGYSILLNKNGNKNESIIAIDEAIDSAKKLNQSNFVVRLEELKVKMIKGEKAW